MESFDILMRYFQIHGQPEEPRPLSHRFPPPLPPKWHAWRANIYGWANTGTFINNGLCGVTMRSKVLSSCYPSILRTSRNPFLTVRSGKAELPFTIIMVKLFSLLGHCRHRFHVDGRQVGQFPSHLHCWRRRGQVRPSWWARTQPRAREHNHRLLVGRGKEKLWLDVLFRYSA